MSKPTIDEISQMSDVRFRNLWITRTYHELGVALANQGLGDDASWLFFGTWASKTAGAVIRGEELPGLFRTGVENSPALTDATTSTNKRLALFRWLGLVEWLNPDHLLDAVRDASAQVSSYIAEGNVLVFSELAPFFAALAHGDPAGADLPAVPNLGPAYRTALAETDPDRRGVQVLAANVEAVAHEQQRLQKCIADALALPIEADLTQMLGRDVATRLPWKAVRVVAAQVVDELARQLNTVWQEAVTLTLMKLQTFDEVFDLHRNLPALPGRALFCPPLEGQDGAAALEPWDRTRGAGNPCGAGDWAELEERMGYIVNLFRSRQRHPSLAEPPFSPAQMAEMDARQMPAGPL